MSIANSCEITDIGKLSYVRLTSDIGNFLLCPTADGHRDFSYVRRRTDIGVIYASYVRVCAHTPNRALKAALSGSCALRSLFPGSCDLKNQKAAA